MTSVDEVRLQSVFYRALVSGKLTFLLCANGHKYQLHDLLRIAEVGSDGRLTGHVCYVHVTFVIADPAYGVREGYAAVSVKLKIQSTRTKMASFSGQGKKPKE